MKHAAEGNKSTKQAGQQKGFLSYNSCLDKKHKYNLEDMIENTKKLLAAVNLLT